VIVQATLWWSDTRGRRHRDSIPLTGVSGVLQAIADYWGDPYANLGYWKTVNRAKSHPGARPPDYADGLEGCASD
jgi:hypothetical protein